MMMGIWFVALGFGGEFAGWLAKLSSVSSAAEVSTQLPIYRSAFLYFSLIAFAVFAVAVFLFVIQIFLRKILED
jgi:dipeptide/tripeptide permease